MNFRLMYTEFHRWDSLARLNGYQVVEFTTQIGVAYVALDSQENEVGAFIKVYESSVTRGYFE